MWSLRCDLDPKKTGLYEGPKTAEATAEPIDDGKGCKIATTWRMIRHLYICVLFTSFVVFGGRDGTGREASVRVRESGRRILGETPRLHSMERC